MSTENQGPRVVRLPTGDWQCGPTDLCWVRINGGEELQQVHYMDDALNRIYELENDVEIFCDREFLEA